jgi:SprT protein
VSQLEPIGALQQREVLDRCEHFIRAAEASFGKKFVRIPVLFDLSGSSAGMYKVYGKRRWIRFNPWIFSKHYGVNLKDTVPHEVAHYIVDDVYGRRAKPHGAQWQTLMAEFGADPGVTFNLDLTGVPRRVQRTHPYQCGCEVHQVSSTRHNRIVRGKGSYYCRKCEGELQYAG